MAIPSGAIWEVRTTGSNQNGGFFNPSRGGADYSQQDDPVLVLTDGACSGNTTVTSATGGFTAAMVGNGININGTIYEIVSRQSSNQITIDRNGPNGTGLTLRVGGAVPLTTAISNTASGSIIWVKQGTYNVSSSVGSSLPAIHIAGYSSTRGDSPTGDARPLIQPTTGSMTVVNLTGERSFCANLRISNNAQNNITGFSISPEGMAYNCTVTGAAVGFLNTTRASACEAVGCTQYGFQNAVMYACVVRGNGVTQVGLYDGLALFCVFWGTSSHGISQSWASVVWGCTFHSIGGSGVFIRTDVWPPVLVQSCLFSQVSGYAISYGHTSTQVRGTRNAIYAVTGGFSQMPKYLLDQPITLTQPPFVDAAGGDFRLNDLPGGGALCRAAGIGPVGQQSALDIGAVQTAADSRVFVFEDD